MGADIFQQAWQAQASQTRVTVDADLLLKEVVRNQRNFRALVFWRDFREILIGIAMLPYWFYSGFKNSLPWMWWLEVPAITWVVGFMLVYRLRHKQSPSEPGEPLLDAVRQSLAQVDDQVWLLRNIFWWYLLPNAVAFQAFLTQVSWQVVDGWREFLASIGFISIFVLVFYGILYYVNQRAVTSQLEPRRKELLALLDGLGDESAAEYAQASRERNAKGSRTLWRWILGATLGLELVIVIVLAPGTSWSNYDGPPQTDGPAGDSLGRLVGELCTEKTLVGLAAMVMVDGASRGRGGQRRA